MRICQHGAKIFIKMCSFEVSKGLMPSFQSSHQKNHCYGSFIKICQHGAKIFNKMCSFEVSIGLMPSFQSSHQKNHCYGSFNMEPRYLTKCAVLKLAYSCHCSIQSSHQKKPCYRGLVKIHQHGSEIFNKMCSFEVSIGLLLLILIMASKEALS